MERIGRKTGGQGCRLILVLALPAFLALLSSACGPAQRMHEIAGATMGTTYVAKVVLGRTQEVELLGRLPSVIQGRLDEVDAKMSTYKENSELSRFNEFDMTAPFEVSEETAEVFRIAHRISEATGGAFDITVGPLVNAWGFGPEQRPEEPPSEEVLRILRERVGFQKISVDGASPFISKTHPETYCDLSAIAKGYGVDRVARGLDEMGVRRYMVEVGGEVRTRGLNASGGPWRIAIERPARGARAIETVVPLIGYSLATSGDYRNFFERDGRLYSHIIDPRTGLPTAHKLASVSVIHRECAVADALATALLVLGPESGKRLAEEMGLVAIFLNHSGASGFEMDTTTNYDLFLQEMSQTASRGIG